MNREDKILSIIREKLESHKVEFDTESGWNEMQSKLAIPPKKRKTIHWLGATSGIAAAIVLLIMLVKTHDNPENCVTIVSTPTVLRENIAKSEETVIADNFEEIDAHVNEVHESSATSYKANTKYFANNESKSSDKSVDHTKNSDHDQDIIIKDNIETFDVATNQPLDSNTDTDEKQEDIIVDDNYLQRLYSEDLVTTKEPKKQKSGDWQLGLGMKSSGSNSGEGSSLPSAYSLSLPTAVKTHDAVREVETDNKEKHNVPLSFGVKVKKKLTDRFAIQTGINYTYLHSSFKSGYDGIDMINRTQDLHYVGIPIAVSYSFINKPKWEMYALAGGSFEKGLANVVKEKGKQKTSNISGIQSSLNLAVGVQYSISKNLNLFFDPSVSYYFDNNQPISARTNTNLTFELSAGLGISL